jgi:hypothetical protein
MQIGEVALAYNPIDASEQATSETIRFENFATLEKVAPNPQFIDALPDKEGTYSVSVTSLSKTTIAFKYQVHLDESTFASHAPVLLAPAWKVEPTQTFVRLAYSLNPEFAKRLPEGTTSITLSNVIVIVHLDPEGASVLRCQAAGGGLFAREKHLVYWRLNEVTLSRDAPAQLLRAKFFTEGEAKPGSAEARWEITGDQLASLGTVIGISRMETASSENETADPFADEDAAPSSPAVAWKEVKTVRRLRSGSYVAT